MHLLLKEVVERWLFRETQSSKSGPTKRPKPEHFWQEYTQAVLYAAKLHHSRKYVTCVCLTAGAGICQICAMRL